MVALQNGAVGVVAPSRNPSEIRVCTGRDDVAVSADEACQGKLSAFAQLALSADGISVNPFTDTLTGEKVFLKVNVGSPGNCVSLIDSDANVVTSITPVISFCPPSRPNT